MKEEFEESKYAGPALQRIIKGRKIANYLPPKGRVLWDESVKKVSKEMGLPLGWNGEELNATTGLYQIIRIGTYWHEKLIPIAKKLDKDIKSYVEEISLQSADNVAKEFVNHPEIFSKTIQTDDEIEETVGNGLIARTKKLIRRSFPSKD